MGTQASRGEIDPEGIEVGETIGPRAELDVGVAYPAKASCGEQEFKSNGALDGGRAHKLESGLASHVLCAKM